MSMTTGVSPSYILVLTLFHHIFAQFFGLVAPGNKIKSLVQAHFTKLSPYGFVCFLFPVTLSVLVCMFYSQF